MNDLAIAIDNGKFNFFPGEEVAGTASWQLEKEPKMVELRLFWYTAGKGTEDLQVIDGVSFNDSTASGSEKFRFKLPMAPYSFSGQLISLCWALELLVSPGSHAVREEFSMSNSSEEIILNRVD